MIEIKKSRNVFFILFCVFAGFRSFLSVSVAGNGLHQFVLFVLFALLSIIRPGHKVYPCFPALVLSLVRRISLQKPFNASLNPSLPLFCAHPNMRLTIASNSGSSFYPSLKYKISLIVPNFKFSNAPEEVGFSTM